MRPVFRFFALTSRTKGDLLPSLDLFDFDVDDLEKKFDLWAIDTGFTEVFVAVGGQTENPHRVRKLRGHEYYRLAGYDTMKQRFHSQNSCRKWDC